MDIQWLRDHTHELKLHLEHFQLMQHQLEAMYHRSLHLHSDSDLKSTLMETYSINLDRQQKAVEVMRKLYLHASAQLDALETKQGP